jgi:hypothetical protein
VPFCASYCGSCYFFVVHNFWDKPMGKNKMTFTKEEIVDALEGNRNLKVASAIRDFCIKNELTSDMRIYFNGICWDFDSNKTYKVIEDIKGSDYFEYAKDDGISVTTEGELYSIINGEFGWSLKNAFDKVLNKFNCYYEQGNAWNFVVVFEDD